MSSKKLKTQILHKQMSNVQLRPLAVVDIDTSSPEETSSDDSFESIVLSQRKSLHSPFIRRSYFEYEDNFLSPVSVEIFQNARTSLDAVLSNDFHVKHHSLPKEAKRMIYLVFTYLFIHIYVSSISHAVLVKVVMKNIKDPKELAFYHGIVHSIVR